MSNSKNWVEKLTELAGKVYKFLGKFAIPFTTPFFAIYNCYKLMECVKNEHLKVLIFIVTVIYVIMTLTLAIYFAFFVPTPPP